MTGSIGSPRPVIRSGRDKQIGVAGVFIDGERYSKDTIRPVTSRLHPRVYALLIGLALWFALSVWNFAGAGVTDYLLFIVRHLGFVLCAVAAFGFGEQMERKPWLPVCGGAHACRRSRHRARANKAHLTPIIGARRLARAPARALARSRCNYPPITSATFLSDGFTINSLPWERCWWPCSEPVRS